MSGIRGAVLIVEDSPESAELLRVIVDEEGFKGVVCPTVEAAERALAAGRPVAVLLDWVLPDRPGIELCRQLRQDDPLLPILFVSGRQDEGSISRGLDSGADDFLVKPVRRSELVARLEAHLRKAQAAAVAGGQVAAPPRPASTMRMGTVEVDFSARTVAVGGEPVLLGPLEFRLLEFLAKNVGVAVSREQILSEVYGYHADISTERVDLLVRRLRSKLGEGHDKGGQVVAVPGFGYRLERRGREQRPEG